jgi:hypothetical protein
MPVPDLTVQLSSLSLKSPVICGAGEHVADEPALRAAVDAGAAAVVAKSANESEDGRRQWDVREQALLERGRHVVERGRTAGLGQPHERLAIAGRTGQSGRRDPAHRGVDGTRDRGEGGAPQLRIAHHAALPDALAADLELRLDHRQAVEPLGSARQHGRQHLLQRDERDVHDDQVGRVRQLVAGDSAGVRALDHRHTGVAAQPPVELAVRDVERHHVRGAALQQAVGEAAGGGADVQRPAPLDRHAQGIERVRELDPAARHVFGGSVDAQLHVLVHHLPGLRRPGPPGAQVHLAGDHGRRGAGPRREQPTVRQQAVEADPGHGATR